MLRLGWKNRCFIRCGLRSKASMSVFLCGSLRRHTGGETTQNQHFLSSQKGGIGDGSFPYRKDPRLHGHVKPSSAGYGERCQFDAYCKLVLYHEAIDYLREMQRHRDRELSFSDLPQMEMDKLCVVDHYPSDRFTFSSHGYDLHIENELVADAFAGLSVQEQSILILHFVLDLPDQEVGRLVGMSRSAVQRRRAKSLTELRIKLAALMPKGG